MCRYMLKSYEATFNHELLYYKAIPILVKSDFFCLATSPTATYEAEVIEVGIALLHGCCGIAQLSTAVFFIASHHCNKNAIRDVVQANHLEDVEKLETLHNVIL